VSVDSTSLAGWRERQCAHEVCSSGNAVSVVPFSGPLIASCFSCDHSVVQQNVAVVEQPGDSEVQRLATRLGIEGDAGTAQRAVGDCHRRIAVAVIDDLVPVQDPYRIGTRDAAMDKAEHAVVRTQARGRRSDELRPVDRRDAVFRRAAAFDFRRVDQRPADVEAVVQAAVDRRRRRRWRGGRGQESEQNCANALHQCCLAVGRRWP
jgi:hypothetical protein